MSNSTVIDGWPVLNPLAPSVFLPPETAYEQDVARYVLVGTVGVYVWDILNNLQKDYIFVARHTRLRLLTVIYFLSRFASFGFALASTIFLTAPTSNCFHFAKGLEILFSIGISSTSLLFFFRARAVFNLNRIAVCLFGVLWLSVVGGVVTAIPGISGTHVGPTRYCVIGEIQPYSVAATITPLINDSIVFISISWRLWSNSWARRTLKNGVRTMVFGDYLPSFSRSMLQDGQVYFLTTVSVNILTVSMLYAASLPSFYRTMCTIPNAALMNIMACRIYRRMLMTGSRENLIPTHSSPSSNHNAMAPISLSLVGSPSARTKEEGSPTHENLIVNLTKTVEYSVV